MSTQSAFFGEYAPFAIEEQKRTGIPASIILAQAALESGWGESSLAQKAYNFFGIKADSSWSGSSYFSTTTEQDSSGSPYVTVSAFRSYNNVLESFQDHSNFLLGNSRYAEALKTTNANDFATELQKAGYATDTSYASKLQSLISEYGLTKYDTTSGEGAGYGTSIDYSSSAGNVLDNALSPTNITKSLTSVGKSLLIGVAIILVLLVMGFVGYKAID